MKNSIITTILVLLTAAGITAGAQERQPEYLGLPGDNLNLYAVMNLFQESETLEQFERDLNSENSRINNLDLNGDRLVDYITVTDYPDGNAHNIVLRVPLDQRENQDVAVFTVERYNDGSVAIQLIGDEDLYGRNYIIEPNYDDSYGETPNPGYTGRVAGGERVTVVRTNYIEVAAWPVIRFIYTPGYYAWRSVWHWGYWPAYWNAWSPYYWHYYSGYHSRWYPHYYSHYRLWHQPRIVHYHNHYHNNIRVNSPRVKTYITEGRYRSTYSRPELRQRGEAQAARLQAGERGGRQANGLTQGTRERSTTVTGNRSGRSTSATSNSRTAVGSGTTRDNNSAARRNTAVEGNTKTARTPAATQQRNAQPAATQQRNTTQRGTAVSPSGNRTTTRTPSGNVGSSGRQAPAASKSGVTTPSRQGETKAASRPAVSSSGARSSSPGGIKAATRSSSSSGRQAASVSRSSSSGSKKSASVSSRSSSSSGRSAASVSRSSSGSGRSGGGSSGRVSSSSSSSRGSGGAPSRSSGGGGRSSGSRR